jgi:large conductance mechanosensitive channel
MLKDFKAFILRGNVVDLAVGVVIGAAFGTVVTSLVEDIFTPLLAIPGKTDFSQLTFTQGGGVFKYGNFINAVIAFVSIAAVVFFFVVRPVNALAAKRKTEPDVESTTRECPWCLSSIPVGAGACAFCTREVPAPPAPAPEPTAAAAPGPGPTAGGG